jgi:hypothetical protein
MTYHLVYETENLINGMKYIGKHSTDNIDDGYLGSGIELRKDVIEHGKNNFQRTILEQFDTEQEAFEYEKQLVTMDTALDKTYYNQWAGGAGSSKGWFAIPENKEKHLASVNALEVKRNTCIAQKECQNRPKILERKSKAAKAWHNIPGNNEKHRKSMKECHNRPEVIKKLRGHTNNKLVKEQVIEIKKRLLNGEKQSYIARDYDVDASTISYINSGKVWGYLKVEGGDD